MMKLSAYILLVALIISCRKDSKPTRYDVQFSISFKLDGKEYKKVYEQDAMNGYTASGYTRSHGITYILGPTFTLDSKTAITFFLGNYHYAFNDSTGNLQRLKYLLRPGTKHYTCINYPCDTALTDAVQISFSDDPQGVGFWSTTKRTSVNGTVNAVVDQPGSHFTVLEMKESTTNGVHKNAVIIKGTFECALYEATNITNKKLLKDGQFTCIIPVL
jgi:hypothetical protein